MKIVSLFVAFVCMILASKPAYAIVDPLSSPNNRYGIHIISPHDLDDAARLVNSTGGEWGYVTFVIRQDERDLSRWSVVFDRLDELKLIPLVRIATVSEDGVWQKLDSADIGAWVGFLDALDWPVTNRYVIVGNEPNHAKEWGGEIAPEEYASYLIDFSVAAKHQSEDFYILNAGFDATAPNDGQHMDEADYLNWMYATHPGVFDHIDGWSSHSYPNPAFSGSSTDTGKGSVKTYEWELEHLKSLGLARELPVFITETGWAHDIEGDVVGQNAYGIDRFTFKTIDEAGDEYVYAYEEVWDDDRIVAVTPFVLSHPDYPFENFSWKDRKGNYHNFYDKVASLPKVLGEPVRPSQWSVVKSFSITDGLSLSLVENRGDTPITTSNDTYTYAHAQVTIRPLLGQIDSGAIGLAYIDILETDLSADDKLGMRE